MYFTFFTLIVVISKPAFKLLYFSFSKFTLTTLENKNDTTRTISRINEKTNAEVQLSI